MSKQTAGSSLLVGLFLSAAGCDPAWSSDGSDSEPCVDDPECDSDFWFADCWCDDPVQAPRESRPEEPPPELTDVRVEGDFADARHLVARPLEVDVRRVLGEDRITVVAEGDDGVVATISLEARDWLDHPSLVVGSEYVVPDYDSTSSAPEFHLWARSETSEHYFDFAEALSVTVAAGSTAATRSFTFSASFHAYDYERGNTFGDQVVRLSFEVPSR